jgi:hypothetical protein
VFLCFSVTVRVRVRAFVLSLSRSLSVDLSLSRARSTRHVLQGNQVIRDARDALVVVDATDARLQMHYMLLT